MSDGWKDPHQVLLENTEEIMKLRAEVERLEAAAKTQVERWRDEAEVRHCGHTYITLYRCADQLEAALEADDE